jgi:hypothetical protein
MSDVVKVLTSALVEEALFGKAGADAALAETAPE